MADDAVGVVRGGAVGAHEARPSEAQLRCVEGQGRRVLAMLGVGAAAACRERRNLRREAERLKARVPFCRLLVEVKWLLMGRFSVTVVPPRVDQLSVQCRARATGQDCGPDMALGQALAWHWNYDRRAEPC